MTTTTPPAALVPVAPVFTDTGRLALAGFLASYSGLTREAYELDLRQYASWWSGAGVEPPTFRFSGAGITVSARSRSSFAVFSDRP